MCEIPRDIKISERGETFKIKTGVQCGFFKLRVSSAVTNSVEVVPAYGFLDQQSEVEVNIKCTRKLETNLKIQFNFHPCLNFRSISELFNDEKNKQNITVETRSLLFEDTEDQDFVNVQPVNYEEDLLNRKLFSITTDLDTYLLHHEGELSDQNVKLLSKIAGQLGISQAAHFRQESIQDVTLGEEDAAKNPIVTSFIEKLCNFPKRELSEVKKVRLNASYVLLQQTTQLRLIPREASKFNLQLLALSGSKKLIQLVQERFGGGSYWYLRDHYHAQNKDSGVLCRPENGNGVVIPIADNIQPKVTASTAYVANQKMPLQVCYNLIYGRITFYQNNVMPRTPDLILATKFQSLFLQERNQPGKWAAIGPPSMELMEQIESFEERYKKYAVTVLRSIVAKRIEKIIKHDDPVQASFKVQNSDTEKVCCFCAKIMRVDLTKCQHCHRDVKYLPPGKTLYDDVPDPLIGRRIEAIPGKIADINPNGFDNCRDCLRHIEDECLQGDEKLGLLYQDSVPYKYMKQNQQYVRYCEDHGIAYYDFPWDRDVHHTKCTTRYRYNKIILENSFGHIDFGLEAELTEIVFTPYLKDISTKFGISTPAAIRSLSKATNHHKQIKALWSLFYGLLDELCVLYLDKRGFKKSESFSSLADDFLTSFPTMYVNENIQAAFDITILGMFRIILRKAIRKGQSDIALGAFCALKALPFSQHHPTAIETRMRWMADLVSAEQNRPDLFMMMKLLLTVSKSSDTAYQPPDLHQEEIIPWLNNLLFGRRGNFENFTSAAINLRSFGDLVTPDRNETSPRKMESLEEQILTNRCILRQSPVFANPNVSSPLVSVGGQMLSRNFHNLVSEMNGKCERYRKELVKSDYSQVELEQRTPITYEEEESQNSLYNQPQHVIYQHVISEIEKLSEGTLKDSLKVQLQGKPKIRVKKFQEEFNLNQNSIPKDMCDHGCLTLCRLENFLQNEYPEILASQKFKDFVHAKLKCWRKSELIEILENIDIDEAFEPEIEEDE